MKTYSTDVRADRSLRFAVRESNGASVMSGAGETYFSAYAILLRASNTQIAFLAAAPALLGSLVQLIAAWLHHVTDRRKPLIMAGLFLQALVWLPLIWLPYYFPSQAVAIVIACIVLYYAGGNFAAPSWNSLLGDLVPEGGRGRYFGHRSRLANLWNFLALTGAGIVLHFWKLQGQERLGFMLVFSVALLARLYSLYQVARMHEPVHEHSDAEARTLRGLLTGLRDSHFMRFSLFNAAMNFAAGIAGPFFAVYMLRDLGFSYLQFTASTAIVVLTQFMTLSMWGRLGDAFGNRIILVVTGFLVSILPALWLLSTSFLFIVAIQVLGGLAWAGFHLSAGNFVYDTVAPSRRAAYSAVHNVLAALTTFVGAAFGGWLTTQLSTQAVLFGFEIELVSSLGWLFLISTIARLSTAIAFVPLLREVRSVAPISAVTLLYRVMGFALLAGMWSSVFAREKS